MLTEQATVWFDNEIRLRETEWFVSFLHDWFHVQEKEEWVGHHVVINYDIETDQAVVMFEYLSKEHDLKVSWTQIVELIRERGALYI